eukprot:m.910370 g.910370  ORF g.910370 m.910370 type:complete len:88 (-) comp60109_c0_seq28:1589-1852(-)
MPSSVALSSHFVRESRCPTELLELDAATLARSIGPCEIFLVPCTFRSSQACVDLRFPGNFVLSSWKFHPTSQAHTGIATPTGFTRPL